MKTIFLLATALCILTTLSAQEKSIKDLEFLIGKWQVREDNTEEGWWEETLRTGRYVMDSTYIELESEAVSSTGVERTYRWYIHYNFKAQQFEMTSMFSNWHKVLNDVLDWDPKNRKLTLRNGVDASSKEYHERFGEIVFDEDFNGYLWKGENKYGDPENPGIWKYVEKGVRSE